MRDNALDAVGSAAVPLPRYDYKTCKDCEGHARDVGLLSRHRLCANCATRRAEENNTQIVAGKGPLAARRLRRTIMAAQRELVAIEREQA